MLLAPFRGLALVSLLLCLSGVALAQEQRDENLGVEAAPLIEDFEPGHGSIALQLGLYNHSDAPGDGNPFLDEGLTVIEPVIIYDYDVSEKFGYGLELNYDLVSSASIERLASVPGSEESGASGDNYIGLDASFRHRLDSGGLFKWHVGASTEYDYTSIGLGGNYTWQPGGTDATVSIGLDAYQDSIDLILFNGTTAPEGTDERTSATLTANWYQILSPTSHMQLGLAVAEQSGFLATPYNAVVLEDPGLPPNPLLDNLANGIEISEMLPDSRTRVALYGSYRKQTKPTRAWELGGRLYGDSWGVSSVTIEPRLVQELVADRLLLDLHYRFYMQSESKYFQDTFLQAAPLDQFHTQDSDLGDFNTNTVGFGLRWLESTGGFFEFGLDYGVRSDGLDLFYGFIGWTRNF